MVNTLIIFAGIIGYILIISLCNLIKLIAAGRVISSAITPPRRQLMQRQPVQTQQLPRRNASINQLPTYAPTSAHIITSGQSRGKTVVYDNGQQVGYLLITGNIDATIKGIDGRTLFIDKNDDNRPARQFKNQVISNYNAFLKTME